jgi:dTDP-glucose 4,6-dehydratase
VARRIAVIGSNSFSGSDFIDLVLEDPGTDVIGISRSPEKGPAFRAYARHGRARFTFHQIDLNDDQARLMDVLDKFEPAYVVNFAAQSEVAPSWMHPEHWFQTNTVALARLVNALKDRAYLHRYVHISSPEVYGTCEGCVTENAPLNPSTPYAASKAAADLLLATFHRNFGFPLITIRATNVYGARQQLFKIIPRTVIALKLGRKIQLHGGGRAVKSYIHVRDVSHGEMRAMESGASGATYHLSPDDGHAVRDIVRRICELMGRSFEGSTETAGERLGQDAAYVIDSARARSQFGWRPEVTLEVGLTGVIEWVEANWNLEYVHRP